MEEPSPLKRALIDTLAGAISGGISRTVTSPLDVIKIRFQVQLEPTASWALLQRNLYRPSKYTGIMQATKDIFREEGLPGFWRGNVPALLMYMPYTAIQFTILHKLKTFASGSSKTEDHLGLSPYWSYVSGALAGCAATVGSYPFDLLRTVLASQGEPKVYPNMRSAFVDIIQARGFRGLYAGLSPTLVEIIPYAGLQFGTYDTFKRWMMMKYYMVFIDIRSGVYNTWEECHSNVVMYSGALYRKVNTKEKAYALLRAYLGHHQDQSASNTSKQNNNIERILIFIICLILLLLFVKYILW